MFNDLFEEIVKEAAKPIQNPTDRPILARGYNRHAELRVAEMLKTVRAMVADDPQVAIETLDSRIKGLEDGGHSATA